MKKILWVVKAINRYVLKDTAYFFWSLYRYITPHYRNQCRFYTDEELGELIKSGKSTLRIGDGEIGLLHFCNAVYQVYSDEIRNDFLKIIKDYKKDSPHVLGLTEFVNYTNAELRNFVNTEGKTINRFPVWRQMKITYELIFNKNVKYFDALAFYKPGRFEKLILPHIKGKQVIVVTHQKNIETIKNSPQEPQGWHYVVSEQENAYEKKDKISRDIMDTIDINKLQKSDIIILFAAGLAKTMIYDLAHDGYQVLDIGWGLKSYFEGKNIENWI